MSASNYLENALLNLISGNGTYTPTALSLALYTSNPGENATGAELVAPSYQRKPVSFGESVSGVMANDGEVLFDQATTDWAMVTHFGVIDTSGNLLFYGALTSPVTAEYGESVRFQAGTLTVSLD